MKSPGVKETLSSETWSSVTLQFPCPWFSVSQVIVVLASLNSDLCLSNLVGLLASIPSVSCSLNTAFINSHRPLRDHSPTLPIV